MVPPRSIHLLLLLLLGQLVHGQRQTRLPPDQELSEMLNRVGAGWKSVGEFPFPRGETPIFHFDQGDEGFIKTIPELIHGLDKVRGVVHKQRKITQAFGEAFDQCEACG